MMNAGDTHWEHRFSDVFAEMLKTVVPDAANRPWALFGVPDYTNPGDHAICLRAGNALGRLHRQRACYSTSWRFSQRMPAEHLPEDCVVYLTGGGNFGDLYWQTHKARLELVEACRNHKLVQLPQSLQFAGTANLLMTKNILQEHPDFTLLVRERRSQRLARDELGLSAQLAPDAAMIEACPVAENGNTQKPLLALLRRDGERAQGRGDIRSATDWRSGIIPFLWRRNEVWRARAYFHADATGHLSDAYSGCAEHHLSTIANELSQYKTVITDRLHGAILGLQAGCSVIALDNSYGKVAGTLQCWLADHERLHMAANVADAEELAASLG